MAAKIKPQNYYGIPPPCKATFSHDAQLHKPRVLCMNSKHSRGPGQCFLLDIKINYWLKDNQMITKNTYKRKLETKDSVEMSEERNQRRERIH